MDRQMLRTSIGRAPMQDFNIEIANPRRGSCFFGIVFWHGRLRSMAAGLK